MRYFNLSQNLMVECLRDRKSNHISLQYYDYPNLTKGRLHPLNDYSPGKKDFNDAGDKFFYFKDANDKLDRATGLITRSLYFQSTEDLGEQFVGHTTALDFSARAGLVAYFCSPEIVVKTEAGVEVFRHPLDTNKEPALEISADGQRLAVSRKVDVGGKQLEILLFSLVSRSLIRTYLVQDDSVSPSIGFLEMRFHPNGKWLFGIPLGQNFIALDLETKENFAEALAVEQQDHTRRILTRHNWYHYGSMDVSQDGRRLLLWASAQYAFLYDLDGRQLLRIDHLEPTTKGEKMVRFLDAAGTKYMFATSLKHFEIVDTAASPVYIEPIFPNAIQIEDLRAAANAAAVAGDWKECLRLLEEAWDLIAEPKVDYPDVYNLVRSISVIHFRLGALDLAAKWNQITGTMLGDRYDSGDIEVMNGKIAFERGDFAQATQQFEAATKKNSRALASEDKQYRELIAKKK